MQKMIATRQAYGEALVELREKNDRVVVLDADLAKATQTNIFRKVFPQSHYDVGIAEANMVGMAAGMSAAGLIPFCSTFAIFGTGRAYEQIRNSVAYPHFNVKLALTHAGISVGEDGGSHQSIEDIALMRAIPGLTVVCPADANETREAVFAAAEHQGPVYIRLARSAVPILENRQAFRLGKACVLREGEDVAIFTYGITVFEVLKAADMLAERGISVAVVNMHTIKPLDTECLIRFAGQCKTLVVVEEASVIGGLGEAAAITLMSAGVHVPFLEIGVEDRFGQSGKPEELLEEYGLSANKITERILALKRHA